jgi:hypothetical protein
MRFRISRDTELASGSESRLPGNPEHIAKFCQESVDVCMNAVLYLKMHRNGL